MTQSYIGVIQEFSLLRFESDLGATVVPWSETLKHWKKKKVMAILPHFYVESLTSIVPSIHSEISENRDSR